MRNNRGFILVLMLLFLLVLNLLALSVLYVELLESKICNFYQDKIEAFYTAENRLLKAERMLLDAGEGVVMIGDMADVVIKELDADICGVVFYSLTATANLRGAKSNLQSTVAKLGDVSRCHTKPNIILGQQSFLVRS